MALFILTGEKKVINAILVENDRDVKAAVKPFADYESIKEQLTAARLLFRFAQMAGLV